MSSRNRKRLLKEFKSLASRAPPNIRLLKPVAAEGDAAGAPADVTGDWLVQVTGAADTVYAGEEYTLRFAFPSAYPFESPEVTFANGVAPEHPHIYSNGHICLSILGEDWTPAMNVSSVCTSVLSMMSSCQKKEWPEDNQDYVKNCKHGPKQTSWWYHDDKV